MSLCSAWLLHNIMPLILLWVRTEVHVIFDRWRWLRKRKLPFEKKNHERAELCVSCALCTLRGLLWPLLEVLVQQQQTTWELALHSPPPPALAAVQNTASFLTSCTDQRSQKCIWLLWGNISCLKSCWWVCKHPKQLLDHLQKVPWKLWLKMSVMGKVSHTLYCLLEGVWTILIRVYWKVRL